MDESNGLSDIAYLLIFARGIDEEFNITEELNTITKTRQNLTVHFAILELHLWAINLVLRVYFLKKIPFTAQSSSTALFTRMFRLKLQQTLNTYLTLSLINCTRAHGVLHRTFEEFLKSEAKYEDFFYHPKENRLSCDNAFRRVQDIKQEIESFLEDHGR